MGIKGKYSQMIDKLSSPREFFGLVATIVVATVSMLAWANTTFVTVAKGDGYEKQIADLSVQIEQSNQLLITHIDRSELNNVKSDIKTNESETFKLKQFIRVNGTDPQSEARLQALASELKDLELRKTCIINKNDLCD